MRCYSIWVGTESLQISDGEVVEFLLAPHKMKGDYVELEQSSYTNSISDGGAGRLPLQAKKCVSRPQTTDKE